jgi:hypothetical protein
MKVKEQLFRTLLQRAQSEISDPAQLGNIAEQLRQGLYNEDYPTVNQAQNKIDKAAIANQKFAGKLNKPSPEMIAAVPGLEKYANVPMTDSQMQAITNALITNSMKDPKEQKFQPDRSQLPSYLQNAPEAAVSKYYEDLIANQQQQGQGDYWPRLKGTKLNIMNDDNFKRSGLRTGDTVCIKIP